MKRFKHTHPDELFIDNFVKDDGRIKKRVDTILGDGVRMFLDYLIELKEKQPELFDEIVSDYETAIEAS